MRTLRQRLLLATIPLAMIVNRAFAQVYNGPGLESGVGAAGFITGPTHLTLRQSILLLLYKILSYLALAAVVVIVLAGFYLVVSNGSEEIKEKVKKSIIYVIVGLIIVLFARFIVGFLTLSFARI